MRVAKIMTVMALASLPATAFASETTTYSYDAKGRLVRIVKSGSVNNGVTTVYSHDKADNRARVTVSVPPPPPPPPPP